MGLFLQAFQNFLLFSLPSFFVETHHLIFNNMAATQDLTMRMIPFLDRHLVFPLIEFLELKEVDINFEF